MGKCLVCNKGRIINSLDVGMQPISNRYLCNLEDDEYMHQIVIGQCESCGLVQLINSPPYQQLVPHFNWITFNEPEEHLDCLVETITKLPGVKKHSRICGVSYKEDTTLKRLQTKGYLNTWKIDSIDDLGIRDRGAGIETIKGCINNTLTKKILNKHGSSDILIARHILEHAHDPLDFMELLKELINPDGYIIFEIPDCTSVLNHQDYSTIWEEHILYFTSETLFSTLSYGGFDIIDYITYPYPYENSLVTIVKLNKSKDKISIDNNILKNEKKRMHNFSTGIKHKKIELRNQLLSLKNNDSKIAMFGAGHLACMFINVMDLKDIIDFVVDDDVNKSGLFMPGSRLPIYGSDKLISNNIKLCLTSLSPESETKVMENNQDYINNGGKFASIFPASKVSL